jgi:hypothetical protein
MPRRSLEALAADVLRIRTPSDKGLPQPPSGLSRESSEVWHSIVERWPAGHFKPGALHLLEQFCVAVVAARKVGVKLLEDPANTKIQSVYLGWVKQCSGHCQKLGLTNQNIVDRKSRMLHEVEPDFPFPEKRF